MFCKLDTSRLFLPKFQVTWTIKKRIWWFKQTSRINMSSLTISTPTNEKICCWNSNMSNHVSVHVTFFIPASNNTWFSKISDMTMSNLSKLRRHYPIQRKSWVIMIIHPYFLTVIIIHLFLINIGFIVTPSQKHWLSMHATSCLNRARQQKEGWSIHNPYWTMVVWPVVTIENRARQICASVTWNILGDVSTLKCA